MEYFIACVTLFSLGYFLTEVFFRRRGDRTINVSITDKDGTKRIVQLKAGRDQEINQLIDSIKRQQKKKAS